MIPIWPAFPTRNHPIFPRPLRRVAPVMPLRFRGNLGLDEAKKAGTLFPHQITRNLRFQFGLAGFFESTNAFIWDHGLWKRGLSHDEPATYWGSGRISPETRIDRTNTGKSTKELWISSMGISPTSSWPKENGDLIHHNWIFNIEKIDSGWPLWNSLVCMFFSGNWLGVGWWLSHILDIYQSESVGKTQKIITMLIHIA